MHDVYSVCKPENPLPVIFDSPHSGTCYPDDFNYACDWDALKACEDHFVDELFKGAPEQGATLLSALFPRSYIDANRAIDDIDPKLLGYTPWPGYSAPSLRSKAGIGLVRRLIREGMPIYKGALSPETIQSRIDQYYRPYHQALSDLLENTYAQHGTYWHINCHSMPQVSAIPRRPSAFDGANARAADFTLGDRDGTTCSPAFTRLLRDYIKGLGYHVTINDPFKGVELVKAYSNPFRGRHSLQIEINKALYMDENTGQKNDNFGALQNDITKIIHFICGYACAQTQPIAAD